MMRIGLFGGSFDPPHSGHLKVASAAFLELRLDLLLFAPCSCHSLKRSGPRAGAFHRSNMVALAIAGRERWLVDNMELERGGTSYTIETLKKLRARYPGAEFFLLVGQDAYQDFGSWRDPVGIRKLCRIAVYPRGKGRLELVDDADIVIRGARCPQSSSGIRESLEAGRSPGRTVPAAVAEYISKHAIYRSVKEGR